MAINFTPIHAFLKAGKNSAENAEKYGSVIGTILGKLGENAEQRNYEEKKKAFFDELGYDGGEEYLSGVVGDIDSRIAELNKEMESVNGEISALDAEETVSTGDNIVDADNALAKATKRRELTDRIDEIKSKIENLEGHKRDAQGRLEKVKAERANLTDDEIVRMAKVKGIKDEDIQSYINGRVTQRSYQVSQEQSDRIKAAEKASQDAEKATKDAAKAEEIRNTENSLYNVQSRLAEAANKRYTDDEIPTAEAKFQELQNEYSNYLKRYKELTGKDWDKKEYSLKYASAPVQNEGNPVEPAENTDKIPEGLLKYAGKNATQLQNEYMSRTTTPERKRAIIAELEDKKKASIGAQKAVEEKREGIKATAKGNLSEAKKAALITEYRNTFKDPKPTREQCKKELFGE